MKITIYECDKCHSRMEKEEEMALDMFGLADICTDCFKKASILFIDWLEGKGDCEDGGVPIDIEKYPKVEVPEEVIEEPVEVEKPKKEKKPKKETVKAEKRLDWNKACALKEAGWSNKNIAEETGIDLGTLNSGSFYSRYKRYKAGERF